MAFELELVEGITNYPNPASSRAIMNFSLATTQLVREDFGGKIGLATSIKPTENSSEINLEQLPLRSYAINTLNQKGTSTFNIKVYFNVFK